MPSGRGVKLLFFSVKKRKMSENYKSFLAQWSVVELITYFLKEINFYQIKNILIYTLGERRERAVVIVFARSLVYYRHCRCCL